MPLDRGAAADALDEIAELLELRGENPFRVRAFANGARLVRGLGDFDARLAAGTLTEVKGIGKGLVGELEAMAASGTSPLLEELRAAVPAGLIEIRRVPGLGPKKARTLYEELAVHSLADLEKACREDRLRTLKGFGAKTQEKVLEALEAIRGNAGMLRRDEAQAHAGRMEGAVRAAGGSLLIAGAFRRGETLCDGLDLVLVAEDPGRALQEAFGILPPPGSETRGFLLQRDRPSFIQRDGPRETRVWPTAPGNAAATLWRATGPAGHVDAGMARTKGNEGMSGLDGASDEAGLYEAIGSSYIPPELRGDGSEFALAARGALPVLLERSAIRGAVHSHTNWSDGSGTVAEMFDAALATGLSWLGNSDHSPTATYANGLTVERLELQRAEIEREAATRPSLTVFQGTESDILADGRLDYPDEVLARFDFVVASVHSLFTMNRDAMTARVLRAVMNPATMVLGHPTGRLLLGRKGFDLDIPMVLRACAREGVAVELNAHPSRLDLDPQWMPLVKELGVTVSIGPDAHETGGFADLDHGVAVARRAALPPELVLNTRDAAGARAFFDERRRRAKGGKP